MSKLMLLIVERQTRHTNNGMIAIMVAVLPCLQKAITPFKERVYRLGVGCVVTHHSARVLAINSRDTLLFSLVTHSFSSPKACSHFKRQETPHVSKAYNILMTRSLHNLGRRLLYTRYGAGRIQRLPVGAEHDSSATVSYVASS